MEPPHTYVRDASASVVHHGDYLDRREDHALCGVAIEGPTTLDEPGAAAVCPACEAKLVEYHLRWWREKAQTATAELDALRVKYRELVASPPAAPGGEQARPSVTGEPTDAEPSSLLDHARKDLSELCRQFDEAVPYWRLKNAMQAFSDRLSSDERVLLAEEIGSDGSLIRWATTQAEGLGWRVTNSPVHAESDATWDAWTQDAYQTPKRAKRRWGRSRSHDAG